MCGRFTLTTDLSFLEERFLFQSGGLPYTPRYNIAPTQKALCVVEDGGRNAKYLHWGLIPPWAKDDSMGQRMINARAETVATKPSFRRALKKKRCLVLADGFYEWRQENGRKTPMYIALRPRQPFAFAGLYEDWRSPTGDAVRSCTIITTIPNELLAEIHTRMPVILPPVAESVWLDRAIENEQALVDLLVPYPPGEMEAFAVSPQVNSPAHDAPDCIVPVNRAAF